MGNVFNWWKYVNFKIGYMFYNFNVWMVAKVLI